MLVVSDTSPLRALSAIGKLDLIPTMYGDVLVPPAVVAELSVTVPGMPAITLQACPFLQLRAPADRAKVAELLLQLDAGESEAIALAIEICAEALLIDEAKGRSVALQLGVPMIGVLGVLSEAKSRGLLPALRPWVQELRDRLGFRVSPELLARVLKDVGE